MYNECSFLTRTVLKNTMSIFLALTASLLYFSALMYIIPGLYGPNPIPRLRVLFNAGAALSLHAYLLFSLIFENSGQNLSILNVASLISFIMALTVTLLIFKIRVWILLPVIYSFSALNLAASAILPGAFITHLETHPTLLFHISLALFSYSTLMIATLYAIQLAWIDHQLKRKNALVINPNLPPLMAVERQLFNIILVGEGLLTLTLLTGVFFVNDMFQQGKSHKAFFSVIAWVVYGVLLWGHFRHGWRGRRVIWFSLFGAFLLTLAYFGSRFVREVIIQ